MPSVPKYGGSKVDERGLSSVRLQNAPGLEAFGGGAAALNANAVDRAASAFGNVVDRVTDGANQIIDNELQNKLHAWDNDYVYNPEGGALSVKGKQALDTPNTLKQKFDEYTATLEKDLNDTQRARFLAAKDAHWNGVYRKLEIHAQGELERYDDQEHAALIRNKQTMAIQNYADPFTVEQAVNEQRNAIKSYAERKGLGEEAASELINRTVSDTRAGVIKRMMADGNPMGAEAYFKKHAKDFNSQDSEALSSALRSGIVDYRSESLADKIMKEGYTGVTAAIEKAKEIGDLDLRQATIAKVKSKIAERETDQNNQKSLLVREVDEHISKGRKLSELHPDKFGQLNPKERAAFEKLEMQRVGAAPKTTDMTAYARYDSMGAAELGSVDYHDLLTNLKPNTTNAQWNRITSKWQAAKSNMAGDQRGREAWAGFESEKEMLLREMKVAKLGGLSQDTVQLNDSQKVVVSKLNDELADRALAWSKMNDGKKPGAEDLRAIVKDVVRRNATDVGVRGFMWNSEKKLSELSDSDREKAFVEYRKIPDTDQRKMLSQLRAMGELNGLSDDEVISMVRNPSSPMGKTLRKRMESAYGQLTIGNPEGFRTKLLGK